MPDWKQFVREHLADLGLAAEREQEIIEELAQQMEQSYSEAISRGATESEAELHAMAQFADWDSLAQEIRRAERPAAARLPESIPKAMSEQRLRNDQEETCWPI